MIMTPKAKQYGRKLQEISEKYLKRNVKLFKAGELGFKDDVRMIFDDASTLYLAGGFMVHGDFDQAYGMLSKMDTAVREEVPAYIWNYLEKFAK